MNKIILWALLLTLGFAACKQQPKQITATTTGKFYYTCSMHPQVHEDHDGSCPICGMKLIKTQLTNASDKTMHKITLTATQLQLAGIETDTLRNENIGTEKTVTGTVSTNENSAEEMSARLTGRIVQLFVKTVGEKILVGQPVYSIYSEDLQEAEKEYLLALQQQKQLHSPDVDYQQLITAAQNKLQLWGLLAGQIKALALAGKVSASTIVYSKVSGTVSDIAVHEGDYITEGMTILKTQLLTSLWVEAQLYANETETYKAADPVLVAIPDLGGQSIKGKVEFVNPELSANSKIALIRVSIPNMQGLVRPGMLAYITISNGNKRALAVPITAILTDGKGSKAWIKNPDGSFSAKMVSVGVGNDTYVPILSGLNPGDIVVTKGAYLLNSEAIFKNGNADSMEGMKM